MHILGIELIDGNSSVIKNLEKGWYPFFYCDDLDKPPKDKEEVSMKTPDDFYRFDNNDRCKVMFSCVIGENGSGKSSLFEVLYRIINNLTMHFDNIPHGFERAKGINAILYFEDNKKVGYIQINSMESDDSSDEILFPDEKFSKKLNSLKNAEIEILENLFYTIATNYSIYSFNPDDYFINDEIENFYVKNIFNKNDGYITPFVILPYRNDKGIIDIENERNLAEQRIVALSVFLYLNYGSCLVEGKIPEKIKYSFDEDSEKKYRNKGKIFDKFDVFYEIWKEFCKRNNISLNSPKILKAAISYLAYKTVKIQSQYNFFENKLFELIDETDEENYSSFIERLLNDKSHITLKLRQTVSFLAHPYKILDNGFLSLEDIEFDECQRTIDGCFLRLPPPFYKSDLFFRHGDNKSSLYSLSKMSSGEKQLFFSLSYVLYHLKNLDCDKKSDNKIRKYPLYKNILIVFDEVELYLHPEYQRKLIYRFLQTIQACRFANIESIHIIMATHSPFVLSDIPIQNVLMLKDGRVYKDSKQCFCANIYDILKSQFFMTSPIGEFARDKINDILKLSEKIRGMDKNAINEFKTFISFIDEAFLKKTLEFSLKKSTDTLE